MQIIEGAITIFLGLITYIFVVDFPDKNRFLNPAETKYILKRIEEDRGDSLPDKLTFRKFLTHCSDWTMWAYGTGPFMSVDA
jgi:hypothetical protein